MQKIIGRQINEFAETKKNLPGYFGNRFWPSYIPWQYGKPFKKVNGEFLAKRYNAIVSIVAEMNAKIKLKKEVIFIEYKNGQMKIDRDIFTDKFLVPALKNK